MLIYNFNFFYFRKMIFTEETTLEHLCINYVGNKTHQEALVTSDYRNFLGRRNENDAQRLFLKILNQKIFSVEFFIVLISKTTKFYLRFRDF